MDDFGPDDFGPDGTQAPPPPRFFPDPLAGLVTGERLPPAGAGSSPPAVVDPVSGAASGPRLHDPTGYRQSGASAGAGERRPAARRAPGRPAQPRGSAQSGRSVQSGRSAQPAGWNVPQAPPPSPYAYPVGRQPAQNAPAPVVPPHAPLPQRAPRPARTPQKRTAGRLGCLAVLAVLGGLLYPVVRAIIEAVVRLFS
ncbi:hypothetical protein GCM10010492_42470 [Saccharothrix mutabilis subsp. mutabilis]|uniref:Translation initiation factor IF-2 n=1 Tax=Saccharothrix mutabilis subsp. mutabilis TaxID=66855 RepID=A0ABP3DTA1_9PSEU